MYHIEAYLFKIHSNIVLSSTARGFLPADLRVKFLKALLSSHVLATWPAHTDYTR